MTTAAAAGAPGAHAGGAIVNVSSAAAKLGGPGQYVDYAAAKGAIETFTIGLAKEVAGEGIRVNAVRPGIIATDIHASGGTPGRVAEMAPQLPMKRAGTADEVGEAIVWLLSARSSYTSGSIVESRAAADALRRVRPEPSGGTRHGSASAARASSSRVAAAFSAAPATAR